MKKILIILHILFSIILFSQKQNDNWFFGKNLGINFNPLSTNGYNFISGSQMEALAGSAVISNPDTGQLYFYTDGRTIWNKNHVVMSNGSGLRGSPSSAQPAVIVPKPGTNTIFYVFTMSGITDYLGLPERKGLAYSIVDMSLNSGLGGVTSKNNIIFTNSDTEMLTSTLGHDGTYYWVVTQKENNFLAYKVSATGINVTSVSSPAILSAISTGAKNGLKISPNSSKLAVRHYASDSNSGRTQVYVYDFNNNSGQVTNGKKVNNDVDEYFSKNGMEFSPNSNVLYFAVTHDRFCCPESSYIYFTDLTSQNYSAEPEYLGQYNIFSLQLATNNKIYVSSISNSGNLTNYLSVIEDPNNYSSSILGPIVNLSPSTQKLYKGFPQLVYSNSAPVCPSNLNITTPITSSQDFQVSNLITASSSINTNLNVNFKANEVLLQPGFQVSAFSTGKFSATIDPCSSSKNRSTKDQSDYFPYEEENLKLPVLFPNPTSTVLNIENIEEINDWALVDINGKVISQGRTNPNQSKITINTSSLKQGIYYFNATLKNGELFQKTVMKK